jgi:hypothetical protein
MANIDARQCNRFPVKHGWDALALGRIVARRDFTIEQKLACMRFYFTAGGIRNLYATLTRSGSHWSLLGIAIARDLAAGGRGEYEFKGDAWIPGAGAIYTKLDWREPTGLWDANADPAILSIAETLRMVADRKAGVPARPVLFHTHLSYFRLRAACLGRMKIAVLSRSIYDSMESKYHKHLTLLGMGVQPTEYLPGAVAPPGPENDYNFPWEQLVDDAIEFFNSWGDVAQRHPSTRFFRYDDMMATPADTHKRLTDFWGLNLPQECLEEAFSRITKDEMKKKLPAADPDSTSRVAFRAQGATLTEDRMAFIRDRMERHLKHDFGYGLDWRPRKAA